MLGAQLHPVRVSIASLVRLSRFPATEPYWSRGQYRFDGPDVGIDAFGTCYAASRLDVAFAESVIHESGRFVPERRAVPQSFSQTIRGRYEVPLADITDRHAVSFFSRSRKTLLLADLTGAHLKALGLNNDISASDNYTQTQALALAIHNHPKRWDGIRYVSRQMNSGFAYAIFERSSLVRRTHQKLTAAQVDILCDQFNVLAV